MRIFKTKKIVFIILTALFSCEGEEGTIGEQGETGINSLIKTTSESPGINCENGGLKIEVGFDDNSNNILDSNEIKSTNYVCNGNNGNNSITVVTNEPSNLNCQNGGIKINSGLDINGNGLLEDSEISTTAYVCNGIDGNSSLTRITNEEIGSHCENGGLKIEYGLDLNLDNTLNDNEVSFTTYICNGINGDTSLVSIVDEAEGENCENGGIKINSGIDSNSNGILDNDEIDNAKYVCNGIGGVGEVVLDFNYSFADGTNSSAGMVSGLFMINNFNLDNYSDFNFAKFSARIRTTDSSAFCIVELYDFSSNSVITQAQIQTSETSSVIKESTANFYGGLPQSTTNLGIRIRSSVEGVDVWCGNPKLTLSKE